MKRNINVVVPAKDRANLLKQTIRSVYSQSFKSENINIVVIDDGSKEDLKKTIGTRDGLLIVRNDGQLHGPGAARNMGISQKKSDYLSFLDSDDLWHKDFVKYSIDVLENSDVSASLSLTKPFFSSGYPFLEKCKSLFLNFARNSILLFYYYTNDKKLPKSAFFLAHISSMMFKWNKIKRLKFNDKSRASEDWEFVAETLKRGTIRIIPRHLSLFRYSVGSNTNKLSVKPSRPKDYKKLLSKLPFGFKKGFIFNLFSVYVFLLEIRLYLRKIKARLGYLSQYIINVPKFTDWYIIFLGYLFKGRDFTVRLKKYNLNFIINHYVDLMTLMETYYEGQYDLDVKGKKVVIDIGANIGDFAIKESLNKNVTIYAFEPVQNTYRLMVSNLALNRINNVKPFQVGISDKSGTAEIFVTQASGLSSVYRSDEGGNTETINLINLERVFADNRIKICDLLKVDCEGGEYEIFKNLSGEMFKKIRNIIVEFHEGTTNGNKEELKDIFQKYGFLVKIKNNPIESNIGLIYATKTA